MALLRPGMRVHFVGAGGIGLSALARVLHGQGYLVTGSDRERSSLTDALNAEGIAVHIGHRAHNVGDGRDLLVVVSSAVPADNVEVVEARRKGLPVVKRDALLSELSADHVTIAVAGTHGKTTTSAMIAWILCEAGLDPTFVVGGVLQNLGRNARAGKGPHFVIEADEYDRTFLGIWPRVAVLTALEHDHPDCYPTFEDMRVAFLEFAGRAAREGRLIVCGDDSEAHGLGIRVTQQGAHQTEGASGPTVVTYGCGAGWDWQADDLQLGASPTFSVRHGAKRLGACALQLPGRHNVLNALAAVAACAEVGVGFEVAAAALTRFRGTARRFEVKGQVGGVTVVDDYAHHPTEVRATLAAARTKFRERSIWAVFQPHTYSRTMALLEGFASAFDDADHVLVTPIYAARERDKGQVSGADIVACMTGSRPSCVVPRLHPDASYVDSLDAAVRKLLERVQAGDVVMTLGAGDGYLVGERVLEGLRNGAAA